MKFRFRALSYEPVDGFGPNLHKYNVGRMGRVVYIFGDLDFIFKVTATFCNV